MPFIQVAYSARAIALQNDSHSFFRLLKQTVRTVSSEQLSIEKRPLQMKDFSVKFLPHDGQDELMHDVEVMIFAHADDERLKNDLDELSQAICDSIGEVIQSCRSYVEMEITYSVAPFLGYMGYRNGSAKPKHVPLSQLR